MELLEGTPAGSYIYRKLHLVQVLSIGNVTFSTGQDDPVTEGTLHRLVAGIKAF